MKSEQKDIYYIAGEKLSSLKNSPAVKTVVNAGFDVLILYEPVDEFAFIHLSEYKDHKLVNVTKSDLKLPLSKELKDK